MTSILPIIATTDLDRLHRFYRDLFGAVLEERTPEQGEGFYLGLAFGGARLGLVANAQVRPGESGRVLLSVDVDDVTASARLTEELGGRVLGGPNDMPWGQRVVHVADPDGNPVNLTQAI